VAATSVASVPQSTTPAVPKVETKVDRVVARAREEVDRHVVYDPSWRPMRYPGGDVDPGLGVCTDVVIRGYRSAGIDFQKLVHEDVLRAPSAYDPWVKTPDATIDHRRVGPLLTYLRRHARSLPTDKDFAAGDIVVISFTNCPACSPQHVGVVSDKRTSRGVPLLIHNMGPSPREDDTLETWTLLGHFRLL
jgi:uncharacterized protein YijF (DUF1287 family)